MSVRNIINMHWRLILQSTIYTRYFTLSFRLLSWIHSSLYDESSITISDLQYADAHLAISSGIISQMQQNNITGKKYLIFNPVSESKTDDVSSMSVVNDHIKIVKFVYIGRVMWEGQKNLA